LPSSQVGTHVYQRGATSPHDILTMGLYSFEWLSAPLDAWLIHFAHTYLVSGTLHPFQNVAHCRLPRWTCLWIPSSLAFTLGMKDDILVRCFDLRSSIPPFRGLTIIPDYFTPHFYTMHKGLILSTSSHGVLPIVRLLSSCIAYRLLYALVRSKADPSLPSSSWLYGILGHGPGSRGANRLPPSSSNPLCPSVSLDKLFLYVYCLKRYI